MSSLPVSTVLPSTLNATVRTWPLWRNRGPTARPVWVSQTADEATVRGKVTLGGQPLTGGQLVFNPANYQRKSVPARTASIGDDGSYTVKTLTGSNMVMVSPKKVAARGKATTDPYEMIPLEVNPGDNTFNINLTPRAPAAASR